MLDDLDFRSCPSAAICPWFFFGDESDGVTGRASSVTGRGDGCGLLWPSLSFSDGTLFSAEGRAVLGEHVPDGESGMSSVRELLLGF